MAAVEKTYHGSRGLQYSEIRLAEALEMVGWLQVASFRIPEKRYNRVRHETDQPLLYPAILCPYTFRNIVFWHLARADCAGPEHNA